MKFSEEMGELAQAMLSRRNVLNTGYKGKTASDVHEELADCFNCLLTIADREKLSVAQLIELAMDKTYKWEKKLKEQDACGGVINEYTRK